MNKERYNELMGGAATTEADIMEARQRWWQQEFGHAMRENRAATYALIVIMLVLTMFGAGLGVIAVTALGGFPNISLVVLGILLGLVAALVVVIVTYFMPERS